MRNGRLKQIIALTILGLVVNVPVGQAAEAGSDRLILACNEDGTYTCGNNCYEAPYNGRWCCEM